MSKPDVQRDPNDATATADAADALASALVVPEGRPEADAERQEPTNGRNGSNTQPLVTAKAPDDVVIVVHGKSFPLSSQNAGWCIPAALRQRCLASLWSMVVSGSTDNNTKIRAIEALVRIDQSALTAERQDDWRSVQSSNSNRSNVRVLAELARNKSQAKCLPNKPPKPKK